jgi:hypothetical protein
MIRKPFLFALVVVLMIASAAAFADSIPANLRQQIATLPIVYDQKCDFREQKAVECLIYFDNQKQYGWIVLFDQDRDENVHATMVIFIKKDTEVIAWCRQDVCA